MIGEVGDDEQLFRRVRQSAGSNQMCYRVEGARTIFLHAAFNDPGQQPSLDRAKLKIRRNPHHTRASSEDGIVSLQADAIRRLGPWPQVDAKNKPTGKSYEVHINADPLLGNCAHALVGVVPAPSGGAFKRLKEGLARLATESQWSVQPNAPIQSARPGRLRDSFNCLVYRLTALLQQR